LRKARVILVRGTDPQAMVEAALPYFPKPEQERVVVKPNLILARHGPTTPVEATEAVVRYYLARGYEVVVAEGSGWGETTDAFETLGYGRLRELGVELLDLNRAERKRVERPDALVLKSLEVPCIFEGAYLISLALLKTHSLTRVTLSLKNMLGAAPSEDVPTGKKRRYHYLGIHESIVDICTYMRPHLAIIDGRMACVGGELGGELVPKGLIIFSEDPVAADAVGARLLGYEPLGVKHLRLAEERGLGVADLRRIEIVEFTT